MDNDTSERKQGEHGDGEENSSERAGGFFPPTRWSLVMKMQDPAETQLAIDALNDLCQLYWQPVYVYIRSWGKSPADAEDLAQGFFSMILRKQSMESVSEDKGKLRTFLLVALKRFLANEHHRESALKRGAGKVPVSIDAERLEGGPVIELSGGESPEVLFDRQWALTVLDHAMGKLKESYARAGKLEIFETLKFAISTASAKRPLAEVAAHLDISDSAAKVASHRLKKRYREILRAAIAETIDTQEDVEEEIRYLMSVFSN